MKEQEPCQVISLYDYVQEIIDTSDYIPMWQRQHLDTLLEYQQEHKDVA